MDDEVPDDDLAQKTTEVVHLKKPKKIKIPKREPSIRVPSRTVIHFTADKTTCEKCVCFPKDSPWVRPDKAKLHPCMATPWKLFDYAAIAVEKLLYPSAFNWSVGQVATWMADYVGFPQYVNCIFDNKISGKRLLMLEDPSHLTRINIRYWEHQKKITKAIHYLFWTEYIYFKRSIGLPRRKLYAILNWFKSRTGPTWGIRQNWTRYDILRSMQIIGPKPVYMNHWELVWYQKPDFEKTMFGRIPPRVAENDLLKCVSYHEICREYMAPRKFRIDRTTSDQYIWMQHRPESDPDLYIDWYEVLKKEKEQRGELPKIYPGARLCPKPIPLKGKRGKQLILTRRLNPKPKFFLDTGPIPAQV